MTNGEKIQKDFDCEVCEPIIEDDIIHVIFADKKDSAIGFDWSWWNSEYKEPKSEWEQDHAILKAYSDGANEMADRIRSEIDELYSYVEFDEDLKTSFNMIRLEEVQRVIDKYKAESEDKE